MREHVSVRNEKIDILRGTAVLLMVWGHTIQYMSAGNLDVLGIYLVQGFLFTQVVVRLLYHIPVNFVRLCGGRAVYLYLFCPAVTALILGGIGLFVWLINKNRIIWQILMGK